MIPESIRYPKSRLVSISIFLSLVLHSLLVYIQLRLYHDQGRLLNMHVPEQSVVRPMIMLAPRTMAAAKVAQSRVMPLPDQQRAPAIPSAHVPAAGMPSPVMPPAGRRMYRVGTGFDAPATDNALALGQKRAEGRGGHGPASLPMLAQKTQTSSAPNSERLHAAMPRPTTENTVPESPSMHDQEAAEIAGRVPIQVLGRAGAGSTNSRVDDAQSEHASASRAAASVLSFLAPQQMEHMMRQDILASDDGDNRPAGGVGIPGHSGGVGQQYGDPKYLHYNSKIYTALQESINIVMSQLSRAQYMMLLAGTKHPARVRFALDRDGRPQAIRISMSSGNEHYDAIVIKIIAEASFPAIPRSFNMHVTYHNYGIILYADGTPYDQIGVSPYLEGE